MIRIEDTHTHAPPLIVTRSHEVDNKLQAGIVRHTPAPNNPEIVTDTLQVDMVENEEVMDIKPLVNVIKVNNTDRNNTAKADRMVDITDPRRALMEEIVIILVMVEILSDMVERLSDMEETTLARVNMDKIDHQAEDMDSLAT